MSTLLVVDNRKQWTLDVPGVTIVESTEYLVAEEYQKRKHKVFNLCKSYSYQTSGYYVSLLASARGHKVIPSTQTILEMKSKQLMKIKSDDLEEMIQRSLRDIKSDEFDISVYFGHNLAHKYEKLAAELHKQFHAPLIRAKFKRREKWRLSSVSPIGLKDIPESHFPDLLNFATQYFSKRIVNSQASVARFDLAILIDKDEKQPPSNKKAIQNFIKAGAKHEIDVEVITKEDLHRLAEFDGLFIRETTSVNHHTYLFSQTAAALGLVVIDDPMSILRCTNKVYLAELFRQHKIPAPKSFLVHKRNFDEQVPKLPLPAVLKLPDSAFSKGVEKAETPQELRSTLLRMLESSDVIVVQEFVPTSFDWRVGVLNGEPLYLCKYYMARNHWQIYKQDGEHGVTDGASETLPLEAAPPGLIELSVKAANLIGKGLYGLDIKEINGQYHIIEINDNPSLDAGVEDQLLGQNLYNIIMQEFLRRMERNSKGKSNA